MMDKRFMIVLAAIIAIFGGIIFFSSRNSSTTSTAQPSNHVTGKLDSKVTFLEYGDFQCNVCQAYNSIVDAVRDKYADRVKFQFRQLPLTTIHPNALAAARAAEAADKQGKFWEMHDELYKTTNWQLWTEATDPSTYFQQYASQIGINLEQFKKDFISSAVNDTINADNEAFKKTGLQMATPTFFINGKNLPLEDLVVNDKMPTVDSFGKYIDAELAKTQ